MKKANITTQPTPPEVVEAMNVIASYCKEGGWVEAIIYAEGGASFNLSSIYDLILGDSDGLEKLLNYAITERDAEKALEVFDGLQETVQAGFVDAPGQCCESKESAL